MKLFGILLLVFSCLTTHGQNIDKKNIANAEKLMKKYFPKSDQQNYLLYGINNYYLVLIQKKNSYSQYFIDENIDYLDSCSLKIKKSILDNVFNKQLSPCNFIYSISDSIQRFGSFTDQPKYNYLVLKLRNVKIIEFNLPVLFIPYNKNIDIYPIESKLRGYLIEQIYSLSKGKLN